MNLPKRARGTTLVELILVVTIIAIVTSIAMPSLQQTIDRSRRASAVSDLFQFITMARTYAVMHRKHMTLCPIDKNGACSRDWSKPLSLFEDQHNTRRAEGSTHIYATLNPPSSGQLRIRSLARSYFQFQPTGFVRGDLGNITWCPNSKNTVHAAQLIISRGGRIRMAQDTNNDGIVEDARGRPVKCE